MENTITGKFRKITTFVFDVDGVFTDGTLQVTDQGINRVFSVRDGYAVQMALKAGLRIAIISGGKQENIRTRLSNLGISEIHLGVSTDGKPEVFKRLLADWQITEEETLYMGDDIPDMLLMQKFCVLKACPADAEEEVLQTADYISPKKGGHGAVRDLITQVMKARDLWMKYF